MIRSSRFRVLMSCAFIWVRWSCITKRFLITSLERFLITLIFVSVSRNFAMTGRGPPLFPPGTLCMANTSDASRSKLTVSFKILQRSERRFSCSLSCQLVNLILFFCEYCWLLLARTTAASATCWHSFRFCLSSLSSFACVENFSRRVSNSSWKPSDISFVWCSNSFVLVSILSSNSVFYFVCHNLC